MNTQNEYLDYNDFYDSDIDLINELSIDNDTTGNDISDLMYGDLPQDNQDSLDDLYEDNQEDLNLDDLYQEESEELTDDLPNDNDELPEPEIFDEPLPNDQSIIEDLELESENLLDSIDNDSLSDLIDNTQEDESLTDLSELDEPEQENIEEDTYNLEQEHEEPIPDIDEIFPIDSLEIPKVIPKVSKPRIVQTIETCVVSKESQHCEPCFRKYDAEKDTVGYQLRGNNHTLPVTHKLYSFKLLFTNADNTKYVPASVSPSVNALSKCIANQTPINPFGEILFYNSLQTIDANQKPTASTLWTQCSVMLGYSFNTNGNKLGLTKWHPLYVKCTPQEDGSAIIDINNPYEQKLPSEADGKIYIYLGIVYSTTQIELDNNHVVYYNDGTGIRVWTGKDCYTKLEINSVLEDKQDTLISGDNIKTINNQSLLGSGNIEIEETEEISIDNIKELWKQYITRN